MPLLFRKTPPSPYQTVSRDGMTLLLILEVAPSRSRTPGGLNLLSPLHWQKLQEASCIIFQGSGGYWIKRPGFLDLAGTTCGMISNEGKGKVKLSASVSAPVHGLGLSTGGDTEA